MCVIRANTFWNNFKNAPGSCYYIVINDHYVFTKVFYETNIKRYNYAEAVRSNIWIEDFQDQSSQIDNSFESKCSLGVQWGSHHALQGYIHNRYGVNCLREWRHVSEARGHHMDTIGVRKNWWGCNKYTLKKTFKALYTLLNISINRKVACNFIKLFNTELL